jgi:hypothetical protein
VEWIPQGLAYVQGKIDEFGKEQRALPEAKPDPNILPIRVNFLRTRDFNKARAAADRAGREAFNAGAQLAHMLRERVEQVDKAFDPDPNECRPASFFDLVIGRSTEAMKQYAEIVSRGATAFSLQCEVLVSLATVLRQSDKHTDLDAVEMFRVFMQDGSREIFPGWNK